MQYYTEQELNQVLAVVNGFELTLADLLDYQNIEYAVISDASALQRRRLQLSKDKMKGYTMTLTEAIEQVDKEYGVYSQLQVIGGADDFILAPLDNSLYDNSDIEFIEAKIKELMQ